MSQHETDEGMTLMNVLQALEVQHIPLSIHYNYKGVGLVESLKILGLSGSRLMLQSPNQKICAILEKEVLLHCPLLPQGVTARLAEVNVRQGWITLEDMTYTGQSWRERDQDRVQPADPIYVLLRVDQTVIRACVEDICVGGVALLAYKAVQYKSELLPGAEVSLDVRLTPMPGHTVIRGTVANLSMPGSFLVRIGVKWIPSQVQLRSLKEYIDHRRQEIIAELEERSGRFLEPRGTKDLYF